MCVGCAGVYGGCVGVRVCGIVFAGGCVCVYVSVYIRNFIRIRIHNIIRNFIRIRNRIFINFFMTSLLRK